MNGIKTFTEKVMTGYEEASEIKPIQKSLPLKYKTQ